MKTTALLTMALGLTALALLVAADPLELDLADDVRGLLMALSAGLAGGAGGSLLPQAK